MRKTYSKNNIVWKLEDTNDKGEIWRVIEFFKSGYVHFIQIFQNKKLIEKHAYNESEKRTFGNFNFE